MIYTAPGVEILHNTKKWKMKENYTYIILKTPVHKAEHDLFLHYRIMNKLEYNKLEYNYLLNICI